MKAKLIYKARITYLPTNLPAQFYGLPDGSVHVVYANFFTSKTGKTELEYVFAVHNEFTYDYTKEKVFAVGNAGVRTKVYNEMVDKLNPRIKIRNVNRDIRSFAEASVILDNLSKRIYNKIEKKEENKIQLVPDVQRKRRTASA